LSRLAANSNDYFYSHICATLGRNHYNGLEWSDITVAEMYRFLGIMLKISLSSVAAGGCVAYFTSKDKVLFADTGRQPRTIQIANSQGWAQNVMSLKRFKQIRGTFHPEDKLVSLGKDKCYHGTV